MAPNKEADNRREIITAPVKSLVTEVVGSRGRGGVVVIVSSVRRPRAYNCGRSVSLRNGIYGLQPRGVDQVRCCEALSKIRLGIIRLINFFLWPIVI